MSPLPGRRRALTAAVLGAACAAAGVTAGTPGPADAAPLRIAHVAVSTIPPTPGLRLSWQGSILRTDARGRVLVPIVTAARRGDAGFGAGTAEVRRGLRTRVRPGVIAAFDRWRGGPSRGLRAALVLSYHVIASFADLHGDAVARSAVDVVRLRSRSGTVRYVPGGDAVWVPGTRVAAFGDHLAVKHTAYSVQDASVGGVNVVNRAQQRFVPAVDRRLRIRLLLHQVRFTVSDALFGFRTGTSVRLVAPGGRARSLPLRDGATATLARVPRGTYHVSVRAAGLSSTRPIALSRDQEVRLTVVSYLDIAVVAAALGAVALVLLLVGRPALLTRSLARARRGGRRAPAHSGGPAS
jgi:hypothetical protein